MAAQVLSVSIDFYVRVFVRLYTGAEAVKDMPTKLAYVWQSQGCDSFFLQHVGRKVPACLPARSHAPFLPTCMALWLESLDLVKS